MFTLVLKILQLSFTHHHAKSIMNFRPLIRIWTTSHEKSYEVIVNFPLDIPDQIKSTVPSLIAFIIFQISSSTLYNGVSFTIFGYFITYFKFPLLHKTEEEPAICWISGENALIHF